jgi:hypothetical protein
LGTPTTHKGASWAREAYNAAVQPAGPEPMMTSFSILES